MEISTRKDCRPSHKLTRKHRLDIITECFAFNIHRYEENVSIKSRNALCFRIRFRSRQLEV